MLTPADLAGCMPALITFMTPDTSEPSGFAVDYDATCRHAEWLVDRGVAGVVIAGSTGQSATLTNEEHVCLAAAVSRTLRARAAAARRTVRIVVSAGSNDTASAIRMVERCAVAAAPDAYLHVTGYYNNPPQEGLIRHFTMIADVAGRHDTPIILYNVPSRTNSKLEPETIAELAAHPHIVGIKEATGDLDHVRRVGELTDRATFALISGEDGQVADFMEMGGVGVISAAANVWPFEFQRLVELGTAGRHAEARELQEALMPCVDATFAVKNPIPLHAMLGAAVRPPLVSLAEFREPKRSRAQEIIEAGLAIREFPHCASGAAGVPGGATMPALAAAFCQRDK